MKRQVYSVPDLSPPTQEEEKLAETWNPLEEEDDYDDEEEDEDDYDDDDEPKKKIEKKITLKNIPSKAVLVKPVTKPKKKTTK